MNALELEVARAENETSTLQLHHQRVMLIVIVCGLFIIAVILSAYIYRRLLQMRQLKKAYDQLEEVTTQKERIESELRIARNIQMSMLPNDFPQRPDFDIYASIDPAREVGGDLYDFFVRDNQLFFCIGDVSGKGVPAALFMMVTKSLFRAYSSDECMPDRIVSQMNHNLSENNHQRMFVTLFIGVLDLSSGLLRYCNAGHEAPYMVTSEVERIKVDPNMALGVVEGMQFTAQEKLLPDGGLLFLYTDGLTEATDENEGLFGRERVEQSLQNALDEGLTDGAAYIHRMTDDVAAFVKNASQSDDLTMLALRLSLKH
jgi:sigma-B regulation protein RsbU (phosphoserine phosphatase)